MSILEKVKISAKKHFHKNYKHRKFIFSRFISGTIAFSALHTSLICCVLIQYFKDSGMLPFQLSIIIISKRILRLFCDTIFGLIFDRFGAKIVFIFGRLLKLSSYFVLLLFQTFEGFILAMLLDGMSYSSIYGKISSYIYNNLSIRRKIKLFPKAMSMYYFCTEITLSIMTLIAGLLLKISGYQLLIYISILMNIFSIILLIKLVPSRINFEKYQSRSFKEIFLTLMDVVKHKTKFQYLIYLYGIVSFLAWQFHSISSLILLNMGVSSVDLAVYGSILKFVMAIGALISIIIFSNGIKLNYCATALLAILLFGLFSAFYYNKYVFYTFCLLIVISYSTLEVSIEKNFEFYSDKKIRGTAISMAMTFCSLLSIISNFLIGCIAEKYSYRASLIFLMLTLILINIYVIYKVFVKNK